MRLGAQQCINQASETIYKTQKPNSLIYNEKYNYEVDKMSVFMDKHVLSCEQVHSGSRIIIQEWFDERETKQGHKEGDLDHILKFTARCIPLYYRHIPTTQGLSKHIPHLIFPCTENTLFLWLLVGPFIDAHVPPSPCYNVIIWMGGF